MSQGFNVGDVVRVRTGTPQGHCRTPHYVRGKPGVVHALVGAYPNPEELAYGRPGLPEIMVYRVRFEQPVLWGEYPGPASDTLTVDLFEHWLDPLQS